LTKANLGADPILEIAIDDSPDGTTWTSRWTAKFAGNQLAGQPNAWPAANSTRIVLGALESKIRCRWSARNNGLEAVGLTLSLIIDG
jgi:hypothetical protein